MEKSEAERLGGWETCRVGIKTEGKKHEDGEFGSWDMLAAESCG